MQRQYWDATNEWDRIPGEVCRLMGNCSVYNVRVFNVSEHQVEGFHVWLNKPETKQMYGVPTDWNFSACNEAVYQSFFDDITRSKLESFVYVLDNIRVLLYNG